MKQTNFIQNQIFNREEGKEVEFKEIKSQNPVKRISDHAEKYVVCFLNASVEGHLYCGIEDKSGKILGVSLTRSQRDEIKRNIPNKLKCTDPPIPFSYYEVFIHNVFNERESSIENLCVVEIHIKKVEKVCLYRTSQRIYYSRKEANCHELKGELLVREQKDIHQEQLIKEMKEIRDKLKENPNNNSLLLKMAKTAKRMGDIETMDKAYEKLIELNPEDSKIKRNYASARKRIGDLEGALSILNDALQSDENNPDILKDKGETLFGLHRENESLEVYQAALEKNPDDYTIITQIGILFRQLGNYKESIQFLNYALAKAPKYRVAKYEKKRTYSRMFEGGIETTKTSQEHEQF